MRKEHPILYSAPMVQAINADLKTITRRTRGLKAINESPDAYNFCGLEVNKKGELIAVFQNKEFEDLFTYVKCPYGKVGDLLWVRETFLDANDYPCHPYHDEEEGVMSQYDYKADCPTDQIENIIWKPSIHMPKAACRTKLEITNIKIERLQDISEEDITKEGVKYPVCSYCEGEYVHPVFKIGEENSALSFMPENWQKLPEKEMTQKLLFAHWAELWCSINGRESWNANPWVWAISFKKINKPA